MNENARHTPVRPARSSRNTFPTVSSTTAAEQRRTGCEPKDRREHGWQGIAEQDDVEDISVDLLIHQERVLVERQSDDDDDERKPRDELRGDIMHDRLGAAADSLEPDRHREAAARLQRV